MSVEIYDTTIKEAQSFANENNLAYKYVEHIGDGIVWLFNDDDTDNLQLVVNDGRYGIYLDSAEDFMPIFQCGFDDLGNALCVYNALIQGYDL